MNIHASALQHRRPQLALLAVLLAAAAACQPRQDEGSEQPEERSAEVDRTAGREQPGGAGQQQGQAGTFRPPQAGGATTGDEQGRLPADADLTMRIAATELFPGTARLDPNIRNPYSGNPDAISAGERHFAAFNCGGCHAPLGGGGMGPPLSDDAWIYGSQPAQMYLSILHGRPEGMPAFGSMLPRQTTWELVAYIETLSDIEDYAAEKGFDQNRGQDARAGEDPAGQSGSTTGQ